MKNLLIIIFILTGTISSFGQEKFNGFYEPYIKLDYDVSTNFSQEFILEERTIWYDDESFKFEVKQIDLAHFSKLKLSDKNAVAVGIQYRFRENFDKDKENELRFTEEYSYTTKPTATEFEHRIRAEQRITSSETSHRFRYNFAINRSFNGTEIKKGNAYMIGDLETLLTVAKTSKPEYEQRIGAGVGFAVSDLMKIELVTEYRLSDFTQNLVHELYFVTGLKISL
ncbi:DUF2490 domain-containing protein [Kaistella sp.]|uniref:DUF2490 domain-containing protein n=1 Tax=Kaistella sp. TaxID=2782235 RepID=UPI00359F57E4